MKGLTLQPYLFQCHPAYRAQIEMIRGLTRPPIQAMRPIYPEDGLEHERWRPRRTMRQRWARLLHPPRLPGADSADLHYVVGHFPRILRPLLTSAHVHLDADDPLSLESSGARNRILGRSARGTALALLHAVSACRISLSFWSEIQLRTFLGSLRASESADGLASGAISVLPPAIPRAAAAAKIGATESLRCLTFATGKFWPKGVAEAVTAVQAVREAGENVALTVVGDGVPAPWADFMAGHRHFTMTGCLDRAEVEELLTRHDLLLFLSHHDTYGWVILEAKKHGVPTVATDFYARPEIVNDGIDGLLLSDPFANPYLPVEPVSYAEAHLDIRTSRVVVGPVLAPFIDRVAQVLTDLARDRARLVRMGAAAYESVGPMGAFGIERRRETLGRILLRHAG